ncbi:MAG TPA: hypothetical protein VIO43_04980 [Lutibacter sp.]
MYPIKLGYNKAKERIFDLSKNNHHAESLITSVFTAEKTFRRTLRQLVVSAGFKSIIADKIMKCHRGLSQIIDAWEIFDPHHRKLGIIIRSEDLFTIKDAAQKRNKLVHGEKVFKLSDCKEDTVKVLEALDRIKNTFDIEYGYSGWKTAKSRKVSVLHIDSKVTIT